MLHVSMGCISLQNRPQLHYLPISGSTQDPNENHLQIRRESLSSIQQNLPSSPNAQRRPVLKADLPMTASAAQKEVSEAVKNDNRDVSDLWKEALKAYKGIVGFDLERKFDSVQAMIDQGTHEMENFHKFRHNDKKVDKLRSLFAANLDYIEKGAQQLVSAAVPAFPPAAAIGTAVTIMLSACRQVSADYDIVMVFFEDMNSFLQRITILETRLPKHKGYQNCLMDVFTSFLVMCGFAHKFIELGRFKKWISNLLHGEDTELGGARKGMDLKIRRLQQATEFAILGNTEEIQKMSTELLTNQETHTAMLEKQMQVMNSIRDTTEMIQSDMAKLLKAFNDQKREEKKDRGHDQRAKAVEQNKPPSAKRIRNILVEVEGDGHEYLVLKETLVKDTCTWVFLQPAWDEWLKQGQADHLTLAITGEPGSGKSHIGLTVYERLLGEAMNDTSKLTCAAHFYFREQSSSLSNFCNAITTVIIQTVEHNASLCELVNAEVIKDGFDMNSYVAESLIRQILVPAFGKASKFKLLLLLDGLDELDDLAEFLSFLKVIREENLRITVAFTSRPGVLSIVKESSSVLAVNVTRENQKEDLRAFIWSHINSLSTMRKFDRYVQQRIADKVEEVAPNFLYAAHMLARFDNLGREGAVIRNLEKPLPSGLHGIYEGLLTDCYRRTELEHKPIVSKLLHWLAFAFRPLTFNEVVSLVRLWVNDVNFDIEKVPEPFESFLQVGDPGSDAEERVKIQAQGGWGTAVSELEKTQTAVDHEAIYNDGELPVKFKERSMRSFFIEEPDKTDIHAHRIRPSEIHRQMFLDCTKLACTTGHYPFPISSALSRYAVVHIVSHWFRIDFESHTAEEQIEVMEALASTLANKKSFSRMMEWTGSSYSSTFTDEVFEKISRWSQLLSVYKEQLSKDAVEWWENVSENPQNCLMSLVKAHLRQIYISLSVDTALASYRRARDAIKTQAKKNYEHEIGSMGESLNEKQGVLGIEGLFEDIKIEPVGYRALASLMLHFKYLKPAETLCQNALDGLNGTLDIVRTRELMSRIRLENDAQASHRDILECFGKMNDETVPLPLRRTVCITKARIEAKLEMNEAAAISYAHARSIDPTTLMTGEILNEELDLFSEEDSKQGFIGVLKNWSPLQRLTWLCWEYDDYHDDRSRLLRKAALQSGEVDFVLQLYLDSIQYLENVNAAAPLRIDLSLLYQHVTGDIEAARLALDEVLDSGSTGYPYPITDSSPDYTVTRAVDNYSELLYGIFRSSHDPKHKTELLATVQGLLGRPLALDVLPTSITYLTFRLIVLSRMYLKLGPATNFQDTLQGVLIGSIDALSDTISWNDADNLVCLSKALHILGNSIRNGQELDTMARTMYSAVFCHLDPKVKLMDDEANEHSDDDAGDDGDSATDAEADDRPTDEGDLIEGAELFCDGTCGQKFSWWGKKTAYACMVCHDVLFCTDCYNRRATDGVAEKQLDAMPTCDKRHEFLKLPVEGWRGVADGKVLLEGKEPVEFGELLKRTRDVLCKEAWEEFWRN
ncbi:uncharacterized protein CCOS01_14643 [Colletotrichum costaricense]|uniref:Fungal STAND N-terminal Goodbye domain-containing protein n=1 Tax=Colletotrichum costaricense TaxID=1209916 RepID=A0AAJ0DUD8_9PEZI|nr:uncharacterized protein CCOS01_14643 [Colletotrichum costaricense]KAK1512403.1 hypothetical protein CCOS01_14643 [Colletotrichum costaricense]